jgi:hypothetical protein
LLWFLFLLLHYYWHAFYIPGLPAMISLGFKEVSTNTFPLVSRLIIGRWTRDPTQLRQRAGVQPGIKSLPRRRASQQFRRDPGRLGPSWPVVTGSANLFALCASGTCNTWSWLKSQIINSVIVSKNKKVHLVTHLSSLFSWIHILICLGKLFLPEHFSLLTGFIEVHHHLR